jgi:hypothetical protein
MPKEKRGRTSRRRKTTRTHARPQEEQFLVGYYASLHESNFAATTMFPNTTLRQVRYYREKVEMDTHWGQHGGMREERQKVSDGTLATIIILLSWICDFNPGFALHE